VKSSFGGTRYVHATRINVGVIRRGVNVVEDLATHELTIFEAVPVAAGSR
jgi:hypothetical protein